MKTMTIRNIPDEVAAYISNKAASESRSVNSTTVMLLCQVAGLASPPRKKRDLSWLAGSWSETERKSFDRVTADCRTIRAEDWA